MKVKIIYIMLVIVALIINIGEFIWITEYVTRCGDWGDIPMAAMPWFTSLILLVFAIVLMVAEDYLAKAKESA